MNDEGIIQLKKQRDVIFHVTKNTHFALFLSFCIISTKSVPFSTHLLTFRYLYQLFELLWIFYLNLYQ